MHAHGNRWALIDRNVNQNRTTSLQRTIELRHRRHCTNNQSGSSWLPVLCVTCGSGHQPQFPPAFCGAVNWLFVHVPLPVRLLQMPEQTPPDWNSRREKMLRRGTTRSLARSEVHNLRWLILAVPYPKHRLYSMFGRGPSVGP